MNNVISSHNLSNLVRNHVKRKVVYTPSILLKRLRSTKSTQIGSHHLRSVCLIRDKNYKSLLCRQNSHFSSMSYYDDDFDSSIRKRVLVLGSSGVLGSSIASYLQKKHNCYVIGADVTVPSNESSLHPDSFIQLPKDAVGPNDVSSSLIEYFVNEDDEQFNKIEDRQLHAIICANGGFLMDDGDNDPYTKMMQMNFYPVVAASTIAQQLMIRRDSKGRTSSLVTPGNHPGGLFVAFGAAAALTPSNTPNMMAYISSKAALHHYIQSLGLQTSQAVSNKMKISNVSSSSPSIDQMTALAFIPTILDTPTNRMNMGSSVSKEDMELWTKPIHIAKEIGLWLDIPEVRPHSGSLVKCVTKRNNDYNSGHQSIRTEFQLAR